MLVIAILLEMIALLKGLLGKLTKASNSMLTHGSKARLKEAVQAESGSTRRQCRLRVWQHSGPGTAVEAGGSIG